MTANLTQERLKELLVYDPLTGEFRWRADHNSRARRGSIAGCIDNRQGYRIIRIDGRLYGAHRLAVLYQTGRFPPDETDHINGKRDDNRWANLREASHQENQRNAAVAVNNTSGITGVRWHDQKGKWQAQIKSCYRTINLGFFSTLDAAVAARKQAERQHNFHKNHGRLRS